MTPDHLSNVSFSRLELPQAVLQGLQEAGFEYCTPIQSQTLPLLLANRDVAGQAQTGTGKTIAFLLATVTRLLSRPAAAGRRPNQPRALILAPTRELAIQIEKDARLLIRHTPLQLGLAYGGANYDQQRRRLEQGVDILIGTPGRLIDYFKQKVFDLRAVDAVVLDEADRMFDLGFIRDMRYLLRRCPKPEQRLSMMFSATLSLRVTELAYEHMNNPQLVRIETDNVTADRVEQTVYYAANAEKIPLLLGLMTQLKPGRAIIFANTKRAAEQVCAYLTGNGFNAGLLSGDIPQKKRQRLLEQLQAGEIPILVATDVAARGLHIPDVSHVFNFDLPANPEDYVHRIGRTARAGASGTAISFACEDSAFHLPDIEAYIGQKLNALPVSTELLVEPAPPTALPKPAKKKFGAKPSNRTGKPRDKRRPSRPRRTRPSTKTT